MAEAETMTHREAAKEEKKAPATIPQSPVTRRDKKRKSEDVLAVVLPAFKYMPTAEVLTGLIMKTADGKM